MPLLIQYFLKLSISLAVVYLFYQLLLRKLTFYNSNRWYLLGYTLLAFFIPFIDVSKVVENGRLDSNQFVQIIPSVDTYTSKIDRVVEYPTQVWASSWDKWDWLLLLFVAGAGFLFLRFLIRFFSFLQLRRKAILIGGDDVKLFHVDKSIIPFSFGNAVFINPALHPKEELEEIVRHEFVHVKQKHTIDIVWAELLCILNWYNPFAWLIKAAIRQNLEFIADSKVLENGINKKQYQYLLLKVIGNNHFSIANQFNFSSLKKRIAMMNKMRTARVHLLRFLFILPLLAVILISFRRQIGGKVKQSNIDKSIYTDSIPISGDWTPVPSASEKDFLKRHPKIKNITWGYIISVESTGTNKLPGKAGDAIMTINFTNGKWDMYNLGVAEDVEKFKKNYGENPPAPPAMPVQSNSKGNRISIEDNKGNCTVVVENAEGKEIDRLLLTKWNENQAYYVGLYGEIPPPPPPVPPTPANEPGAPATPAAPVVSKLPDNVKSIQAVDGKVTVQLKNGRTEKYNLNNEAEKKTFEDKYGGLPEPPEPPVAPIAPIKTSVSLLKTDGVDNIATLCSEYEITDKKAIMHLKSGTTEEYDLTNLSQRRQFEKKYGKIINVNQAGLISPVAVVNHKDGYTVLSPMTTVATPIAPLAPVTAIDWNGDVITGDEDILVVITKKTTRDELTGLIKEMKGKNIELKFDEIEYENEKLVHISGTMKSKDGSSNFSVTDFNKLTLAVVRNGDRTYFKVVTGEKKVVI